MSDLPGIAREGIKGLGPGAYLVTAVPSVVLVLSLFAVASSRLYPFANPLVVNGREVEAGLPSIIESAKSLELAGAFVLALVVLCTAVLLRPLQLSLVRMLEGYWSTRGRLGFLTALSIEGHLVRRSRAMFRLHLPEVRADDNAFGSVAGAARHNRHVKRLDAHGRSVLSKYPAASDHTMPTALGNVLRRMETTAGERYGLSTVPVYPRLYPHLPPPLVAEIANQLDVIHSTATFCGIFAVQALAASPLLFRLDWWSSLPVMFAAMSGIAYAGAIRAAGLLSGAVSTAFDLHRFDLLVGLHLPLPKSPQQELAENARLSAFLQEGRPGRGPHYPPMSWVYSHDPAQPADQPFGRESSAVSVPDQSPGLGQRSGSVPTDESDLAGEADHIDHHNG